MRYCWVRVGPKTVEDAVEELKEIPTTPGNMRWVDCVCVVEALEGPCEVCLGYRKMLTLILKGE